MPLNKVIFNNNSQNNNTFLKKGTPEGPKPVELNTNIPIVQAETPIQEIVATASISVPTIPIGSRPNVLRPNISKNESSVKYTSPTSNKNKFTSKLLNYVEPYEIGGVRKTAFYSEISTNFKVGERVFIINGNYDSHDKILGDKYSKGSDGYKVLAIEDCRVVLDIDYTGLNPYESPLDINDLIFVHNIDYTASNYLSGFAEPFNYISTFKTYVTDATIQGELVSFFQGNVTSNVLRTWTGNIIYNRFAQSRNTLDVDFLDIHKGTFTTPTGGAFFVRDSLSSPAAGNWINVSDQVRTNQIRLMDNLSNPTNEIGNKRLYILGEDFTWEGTYFQERQIYKFDKTTSKWIIDRKYKTAIITATYFKYGKFLGEHNGGLFGTYLKTNKWKNATWNYGVMINTDWQNGFMNTNTKVGDRVVKANLLFDQFSIPYVSQVVDNTNNSGIGYNLAIDSKIVNGVFLQSTFENCSIKSQLYSNPVEAYYQKSNPTYLITANFSKFKFCDLDGVILSSSTLVDSIIENSTLKRTKSVNSQIFTSVFDGGEFNSDSGIRILGAELNSWDPELATFTDNSQLVGILKLFISDEDFFRMEKNDTFYIERVNKEFFLGNLDTDNRIILPYETKYLLNLYWDAEFTSKVGSKQAVSVRDKRSNRNRFYVSRSTANQFQFKDVPNTSLINGITWWTNVTDRFNQTSRLSPGYDPTWTPTAADVLDGAWFYYTYDVSYQNAPIKIGGKGLPLNPEIPAVELPGESTGVPSDNPQNVYGNGQTTHIFKYITVPTFQEAILSIDGYTPNYPDTYERVFANTVGPFDPESPGQYRGEYITNISTTLFYEKTPVYGQNLYQVNDIVRIYNPQTEKFEYYQCLVEHDPQLTPDSYVNRQYQIGAADQKILVTEASKYKNYCSIDIETRALGWYRDVQLNKDVYTFDRDQSTITMPLKPKMDNLLPISIVDKVFKNVLIKNSNFHSGIFINSNWVSGSLIEDFELVIYNRAVKDSEVPDGSGPRHGAKLVMSREQTGFDASSAVFNIFTKFNQLRGSGANWFNPSIKTPQLGEVLHINSITYQTSLRSVQIESQYIFGGTSLVGGLPYVILGRPGWASTSSPLINITENITPPNSPMSSFLTNTGTYSIIGSDTINYASSHRVVIENSTVYSGVFKRVYFKNTKLTNRVPYFKPTTFDIDPASLPKVVNVVFARNNVLVENGFIFQSHITNITNTGGYFHSCYWNGATFSNGEFQSGYWVSGTFLNGKFTDSNSLNWFNIKQVGGNEVFIQYSDDTAVQTVNPYISTVNYFDIAKKPLRKVWNDGLFLGGEFYNSYWIDGTFSNGKFWRSKWFAGDFESGILGDRSVKYEETTMGYGWYSPTPVDGVSWLPTVFSKKGYKFEEDYLGRTQSKFFGGVVQNGLIGGNGVVFWYNGQMAAGEFTSASASDNMQSIWYNGSFFGSIFSGYAQWKNGVFNSGKFRSIYGYEKQPELGSYENYASNPVFSWENGTFNGGEFGMGSPLQNSSWRNGNFTNGIFQGRIWYDGVFSGGVFMGSGKPYITGTPSNISNQQENKFYVSFKPILLVTDSDTGIDNIYPGSYYGLWYNGVVTDKRYQYISSEKVTTKIKRAESKRDDRNRVSFENILWMDGLFDHENGEIKDSLFTKGTFSNGTFNGGVFNPYISRFDGASKKMNEFITNDELDLSNYKFSDSLNKVYDEGVPYSKDSIVTYNGFVWKAKNQTNGGTFNPTDWDSIRQATNIMWLKGTFVTGSIYSTVWMNGIFKNGYLSGVSWRNGTLEYGTAENIFWDGGIWKNGNWNGTPYDYTIVDKGPVSFGVDGYSHSVTNGRTKDILLTTDLFMKNTYPGDYKTSDDNKSYLFVSNVFSASPTPNRIGLYNDKHLQLKDSDFFEIWLPYRQREYSSSAVIDSLPRAISWSLFISEAAAGLMFMLMQGFAVNPFTQSYNAQGPDGPNYDTGHWKAMVDAQVNVDFWTGPNPATGDVQPLAQILPANLANVDTPQKFINWISGFTWSGLFTHQAEIYNLNGNEGVKIRFNNYRNNQRWITYYPPPPIQVFNGRWTAPTYINPTRAFAYYFDLPKSDNYLYGFVTSSFFVAEHSLPNPPKSVNNEVYLAKNFVEYRQGETIFALTNKPCSDWGTASGIPYYYDGTSVRYDKIGTKTQNGIRNYVNICSKLVTWTELPVQVSLTVEQVKANPKGYNTYQKYINAGDPLYQNNPEGGGSDFPAQVVPRNSPPSLKLYPRFQKQKLYKSFKYYNKRDVLFLINAINSVRVGGVGNVSGIHKPFNGLTGSRVGFYINDLSSPYVGPFCTPINGASCYNRAFGFEIPPPENALLNSFDPSLGAGFASNEAIDGLVAYLQALRNVFTGKDNALGPSNPSAFSDFSFFRLDKNNAESGMAGFFELYGAYDFPSTFRPFGSLMASLQGPPTTPIEWPFIQLYYVNGNGTNLYQSAFNSTTNTWDIVQYTTEIEVSVELEKEVSFDYFIAGSFSSFTLESREQIILNPDGTIKEQNFFPRFYKIKLNYLTTLENIFTGISIEEQYLQNTGQIELNNDKEDILRSWIRKTSFGILRIYSWSLKSRVVTYDGSLNNRLFASIDQNSRYIEIPSKPSVALNLPTDTNIDNSIMYGNGTFRQGIWENGVWNGGFRLNSSNLGYFEGDDLLKARDVIFAVRANSKGTLWSIKIKLIDNLGTYRLKLNIGAKISVSNLAAYDNNKRRIIISSILEVESFSLSENTITVSYKSLFPISYIEKDSPNHLIYLTTNIWSNGAFLNGIFRGVWNNGLFRGRPFLTKMVDSHFIDGVFEGGHFKSEEQAEGLTIYGRHNTGLIQNFKFKDLNNNSPNIRLESTNVSDIRNTYQSWIDVVYSTYSIVNLKKDTTQLTVKEINPVMIGAQIADQDYFSQFQSTITAPSKRLTSTVYNQPNLRGCPTVDVLSSTSELRDFLTNDKKVYRLGTKRNVYSNLMPDDGNFIKPVTTNPTFSRQINVSYPGLFPSYPAFQNLSIPFFATNTSQLSYGYTHSILWHRVGSEYITPGYQGSTPKTWYINQVGHGDLDIPLKFEPKEITVTSGDIIIWRMNDLRKPALTWPYSYGNAGYTINAYTSPNFMYSMNSNNVNHCSMYPWNGFDKSLSDPAPPIPRQLYSGDQDINSYPMSIFGWNAYNPFNFGSPFSDGPDAAVVLPEGVEPRDNGPLGNRIFMTTEYGGYKLLHGRADDANGCLAWAYGDGGYAYPQERGIDTGTGMRSIPGFQYLRGGTVDPTFAAPIQTNQNANGVQPSGRTGPGLNTDPKTPGLTHGVHFYMNMNRLSGVLTNILSKGWNYPLLNDIEFPLASNNFRSTFLNNVNEWKNRLNGAGLDNTRRFNPTRFNPWNAYGKITVLQAPGSPELGLATVPPAKWTYVSNTDPNTDNILRLTISDYLDVSSATGGPLNWAQLFQNKTIRPVPNRYYELSVDITYNLRGAPTYTSPTIDGLYQGLFFDDIYENLNQESRNNGLPEKNLHQYFNHFYNGVFSPVSKKFRVRSTEYFMNKNNLDLVFYNNFPGRGGPVSIDFSNISLKEVDMLPFFCYFSASVFDSDVYLKINQNLNQGKSPYIPNQIDTSPRMPLKAVAPFMDTLNNNFTFADNFDLYISSKIINRFNQGVIEANLLSNNTFITGISSL